MVRRERFVGHHRSQGHLPFYIKQAHKRVDVKFWPHLSEPRLMSKEAPVRRSESLEAHRLRNLRLLVSI